MISEVPAGHRFEAVVGAGEAVRIFTGSPVPKGADHIAIQEDVVRDAYSIRVMPSTQDISQGCLYDLPKLFFLIVLIAAERATS